MWRGSKSGPTQSLVVLYVSVWVGLCLVYRASSYFYLVLGRFGKTITSVLLLWRYGTEIDRSDQFEAEE